MKRRFLRGASLALVPLALAGSSLSYYSKEIRLQLFGTNQERAIAEIEGRAGSYKIDETLPGKPIVKVDLSFSEIDADCIRIVGNLPHLRYLSLLETSVTDDDIVPLGALTELRSLNLMSTHIRGAGLLQLNHGFRGYQPAYVPPRSAVRVLLRSISKKIAQVVSGLAATIV